MSAVHTVAVLLRSTVYPTGWQALACNDRYQQIRLRGDFPIQAVLDICSQAPAIDAAQLQALSNSQRGTRDEYRVNKACIEFMYFTTTLGDSKLDNEAYWIGAKMV